MSYIRIAARVALLAAALAPARNSMGAQHPFFSFHFGTYVGRAEPHTDTFNVTAGKPVRTLNLSLKTTDTEHLGDSQFLLDFNGAAVSSLVNDAHELSVAVEYPDQRLLGAFVAARITFAGQFHDTIAESSGTFFDGETFSTQAYVGFVPEPSSTAILLAGAAVAALWRRRQSATR